MESQKLLPVRLDYTGQAHNRRFDEFDHLAPGTGKELIDIALRLFRLQNDLIPRWNLVNGAPLRFITSKKQSLVRTNVCEKPTLLEITSSRPNVAAVKKMNLTNRLTARELGGRVGSYLTLPFSLFTQLRVTHRVLGHLSPIFCVAFDRTGRFVFTGADDCLVKVWDVEKGTLRFTFRGHERELTDISVNHENTMLATGSIDKTVRVFCLRSGKTLEVFSKHTAQLTVVKFLPYVSDNDRYLMSTGNDGTVNFYKWNVVTSEFEQPVQFQERDVPNQRIVSHCHSPGGTFAAFGDTCRSIRIFRISPSGVSKLVVLTAHNDRVDSMEWANSGLKFLSGSKDGVAKVWVLKNGKFHSTDLIVEDTTNSNKKNAYRLTILNWTKDDSAVVTAGTDRLIRIWNWKSGVVRHVVKGHDAEAYVVLPHPIYHNYVLSAGYDGFIMLWDVTTGKLVKTVKDTNDSQVNTVLFDMAISPDGTRVAAVDCQGCLLMLGINDHTITGSVPDEQFFDTDYRELLFDEHGFTLDACTELAPHLMSPPILINSHGFPHENSYQRLVPGRDIDGHHMDTDLPCAWLSRKIVDPLPTPILRVNLERRVAVRIEEDKQLYDPTESTIVCSTPVTKPRPGKKPAQNSSATQNAASLISPPDFSSSSNDSTYSESREGDVSDMIESASDESEEEQLMDEDDDDEASDSDFNIDESRQRSSRQTNRRLESSSSRTLRTNGGISERRQSSRSQHRRVGQASSSQASSDRGARTRRQRRDRSPREQNSSEDGEIVNENTQLSSSSSTRSPRRAQRKAENDNKAASQEYPDYPAWMKELVQRRFPFIPQVGDEIMYFAQGHQQYLQVVKNKDLYQVQAKMNIPSSTNHEQHCIVLKVTYDICSPTNCRVLRLKLCSIDSQRRVTRTFSVWMHDIESVPDWVIPKQLFDKSVQSQHQRVGAKMQTILSNQWWVGQILHNKQNEVDSSLQWYSIKVRWENGDEEFMSPWDYDVIPNNEARVRSETQVSPEELTKYSALEPLRGDWTDLTSGDASDSEDRARERITGCVRVAIDSLANIPEVKIFADPVDLVAYPDYVETVKYPVDLSTIDQRLRNKYYRRRLALLLDVWYITENAKQYNVRNSDIVVQAKVLTETLSRIICDTTCSLNATELYEELRESAPHELTFWKNMPQVTDEYLKVHSTLRSVPSQNPSFETQPWVKEANELLNALLLKHKTLDDRNDVQGSQEISHVYERFDSLRQIQKQLTDGNFESPVALQEKVIELLDEVRRTVEDNKRSQVYRDCLTFRNEFVPQLKILASSFARVQENEPFERSERGGRSLRSRSCRNQTHYNTRSTGQHQSSIAPFQEVSRATGRPSRGAASRLNYSDIVNGIDDIDPIEEQPSTSRAVTRRSRPLVHDDDVSLLNSHKKNNEGIVKIATTSQAVRPQRSTRSRVVESDSASSTHSKDASWSANEDDVEEEAEDVEEEAVEDEESTPSSSSRSSSEARPSRKRRPPKRYAPSSGSSSTSGTERGSRKRRRTDERLQTARASGRPKRNTARPSRYLSDSDN
ncbi:hypothetical protein QR680_009545 [Steinernema hermaphroditum]|uniref:Bromo domain-containing protein n=1 Tax=Steinernema hermaphroditum TaxID=289476 RepID=A0AA39IKQ5_9BILA|nr:hypothetical protein QR680_009545 [Steinernema hermaphroditum]